MDYEKLKAGVKEIAASAPEQFPFAWSWVACWHEHDGQFGRGVFVNVTGTTYNHVGDIAVVSRRAVNRKGQAGCPSDGNPETLFMSL